MDEKKEIQKTEEAALQAVDPDSPAGMMMQLMSGKGPFDIEGFGKMLEFQERHEANKARKVFATDFAAAQSNIVAAVKMKTNPQTRSKYADLESVLETSRPAYTSQGFSIIYYEGETPLDGHMRLCADVLHKEGHKETYHIDIPLDGVGIKGNANMTKIHGKASSISYGRRYLLCMIWNIPTQDDDGNTADKAKPEIHKPNDEEQVIIKTICKALPQQPGKQVDPRKVGAILFGSKGRYPNSPDHVDKVVEWFANNPRPQIYVEDDLTDFEKDYNLDSDDEATREAENTAAEKFGEENDQEEVRYACKNENCERDFDVLSTNGLCPHCLGDNITDRRPE